MKKSEQLREIEAFERAYNYDAEYLKLLLANSMQGYELFTDFRKLTRHRRALTLEEFWVAKISAMQVEDCSGCLSLNVALASEAGVDTEIIQNCILKPDLLPSDLRDIRKFTQLTLSNGSDEDGIRSKLELRLGQEKMVELGIAIASARVIPTLKRSLGLTQTCRVPVISNPDIGQG